MVSISQKDILNGIKDLTPKAFQLLMYFFTKRNGWIFLDDEISNALNISIRQLRTYRAELIANEYLLIINHKDMVTYFVGKYAVLNWKNPDSVKPNK